MTPRDLIQQNQTALGIEFGSTRIKAVLTDMEGKVLASGSHTWSDNLSDGVWTYSLDQIHSGFQACYQDLKKNVQDQYGIILTGAGSMGVSAMMHGYLPFDEDMNLLVPFRTWRNTITGQAAAELTERFQFNIPQRWSIAHLHQAILNNEPHVPAIHFLTTLAGYAHYLLTGEKVLGIGDAAGMFPIDSTTGSYDKAMIESYDQLLSSRGISWKIEDILPGVLCAGSKAGVLTEKGALVLDPSGDLKSGIPLCPPEGDAGTGMVATNSVLARTGNVSAGTSVFAMIVLEKKLQKLHTEIDMVTTPTGLPVAMVHCNTCTSDLNAWAQLFMDFAKRIGADLDTNTLYQILFNSAMEGKRDCNGLTAFNYYSGEPVTETDAGVPLFTRLPDAPLTLPDFMRTHLYSSLATLSLGMQILTEDEQVTVDKIMGHGGLFKTPVVGQSILASALNAPVTVMDTASEGGAWGMALLALYMNQSQGKDLPDWLNTCIFANMSSSELEPQKEDVEGFKAYLTRYQALLAAEKAAAAAKF